jgi:hypothetical protein
MHTYKVSLESQDGADSGAQAFNFTSHEDLIALIERVRSKGMLPPEEVAAFVVGLKLFSSVLLNHRSEELFAEFAPHFGQLMKKLKSAG